MTAFGKRLRAIRKEKGYSLKELGEKCKPVIDQGYLSKLENGVIGIGQHVRARLSAALEVNESVLAEYPEEDRAKAFRIKITLGEALARAKAIDDEINKLHVLCHEVATITYVQGEELEPPEREVGDITAEIYTLSKWSRFGRKLVAETNLRTYVDYSIDDDKITLAEAILLLGQMLSGRKLVEQLATNRPKTRERASMWDSSKGPTWTATTYDLDKAKKDFKALEKDIRALRTAIDRANINTLVRVPDEYLG